MNIGFKFLNFPGKDSVANVIKNSANNFYELRTNMERFPPIQLSIASQQVTHRRAFFSY